MPEGPELHLSARFVSASCKGRIFSGKVVKSELHKSAEVEFSAKAYSIAACSRGKEMQLLLTKLDDDGVKSNSKLKPKPRIKSEPGSDTGPNSNDTKILFRFGMSGKFEFTSEKDVHKHAHLKFFTNDKPPMVLSHVDVRRFGRWQVDADWSKDRGPDPMFEYREFRSNVLTNLDRPAFNQPICEVLLNQKYFNGIGNYLRAEILYRLKIPPFEKACTVLEGLSIEPPDAKPGKSGKKGRDEPDILHLCHTVPLEVLSIGGSGYDPEGNKTDYNAFTDWLQCYYQDGMNNMVDHNARTIWFKGPTGPMVPKEGKSRSKKSKKRSAASSKPKKTAENGDISPPKKVKGDTKPPKRTAVKTKTKTKQKATTPKTKKSAKFAKSSSPSTQRPASRSRRKTAPSTKDAINGCTSGGTRRVSSRKKGATVSKVTPKPSQGKARKPRSRTSTK